MTFEQADAAAQQRSENFYAGAYARIFRLMLVLTAVLTPVFAFAFGWRIGGGFVVGCGLSLLNLHWLKGAVERLADATVASGQPAGVAGLMFRFFFRYLLLVAGAYVIFRGSVLSLEALLAGLFLPVAAMVMEAAYELWAALRRGL